MVHLRFSEIFRAGTFDRYDAILDSRLPAAAGPLRYFPTGLSICRSTASTASSPGFLTLTFATAEAGTFERSNDTSINLSVAFLILPGIEVAWMTRLTLTPGSKFLPVIVKRWSVAILRLDGANDTMTAGPATMFTVLGASTA